MDDLVSGLTLHVNGLSFNQAIEIDVLCDSSSPEAALDSSDHDDLVLPWHSGVIYR